MGEKRITQPWKHSYSWKLGGLDSQIDIS